MAVQKDSGICACNVVKSTGKVGTGLPSINICDVAKSPLPMTLTPPRGMPVIMLEGVSCEIEGAVFPLPLPFPLLLEEPPPPHPVAERSTADRIGIKYRDFTMRANVTAKPGL